MRRVVCRSFGPLEDLVVEDGPSLTPDPAEVVIDVEAAGVNFVDGLFVQGLYQIKPPLPFTPGGEVAGTVAAVGEGVTQRAVGDRVLASNWLGGFAEQVAVHAERTALLPDVLDAPRAATFPQSYCTALYALHHRAGLRAGESVLVLGAGGGVGLAAIDVATALGASVMAAASSEEKRAAASAAGAFATIDYTTLGPRARELTGGGVDVVVDPVGGPHAEAALRSLAPFGRFLVVGFAAGSIPSLPLNQVLLRNRSVVGVDWGAWSTQHPGENRALLDELLGMVDHGRLTPATPVTYPLADAAQALRDLAERRVAGKVALVP